MVLCTVFVSIVSRLMIIPDGDKRMLLMYRPQIGVKAILRIAGAVIFQGHQLLIRKVIAFSGVAQGRVAVEVATGGGVLVNVIAQVNDGIQIGPLGYFLISTEVARLVVTARDNCEPKAVRFIGSWSSTGTSDDRGCIQRFKLIKVRSIGSQTGYVYFDGIISFGVGYKGSGLHHMSHCGVGSYLPPHVYTLRRRHLRGHTCPDDDPVWERIA